MATGCSPCGIIEGYKFRTIVMIVLYQASAAMDQAQGRDKLSPSGSSHVRLNSTTSLLDLCRVLALFQSIGDNGVEEVDACSLVLCTGG